MSRASSLGEEAGCVPRRGRLQPGWRPARVGGQEMLGGEGAGPGTITGCASWQPVPQALQDK